MVPRRIQSYLEERGVPFQVTSHGPRATAQATAQATHISGKRFAKAVVLKHDGEFAIAVIPAAESVDLGRFRGKLGDTVELASESELERLFPDCEVGAMPPLGGLFGLPVVADECLAHQDSIAMNGGTHTDVIQLRWTDYVNAEHPWIVEH
jgi:Ala-tRNA(Pro) deacylase